DDSGMARTMADKVRSLFSTLSQQLRGRPQIGPEARAGGRRRSARDLYHSLGQAIPEIERIALRLRDRRRSASGERASDEAADLAALARNTLAEARRSVADLVPRELDASTLEEG